MGDIVTAEYKKNFLLNLFYAVSVLGLIFIVSKYLFAYFFPFIIGVCIAFAVQKPANTMSHKFHIKKEIFSVFLTVIICILFFAGIGVSFWALGGRLSAFIGKMPEYFSKMQEAVTDVKNALMSNMKNLNAEQKDSFQNILSGAVNNVAASVMSFVSSLTAGIIKNLPAFLVSSIVTVVASCYIAKDFDRLKNFALGILPEDRAQSIADVKEVTLKNTGKFLKGYSLITLITFFELLAVFTVLKIKNPFFTALIVALVDMLPVLGVGTVLLPWSAIELLRQNFYIGFGLLISYALMAVVRNFIEPKIIGAQMGINPVFTLAAMFLGLKVSGVVGMLTFPLALTVIIEYYRKNIK